MTSIRDNEGVRVQEALTCYLCEEEGLLLYSGLRDRLFAAPGEWNLRRCPGCGLIWLDPMPIPQDIGKLYVEYLTHTIDDAVVNDAAIIDQLSLRKGLKRGILSAGFGYKEMPKDWKEEIGGQILSRFSPLRERIGSNVMWLDGSKRGRLLDVGCGSGRFLAKMRNFGWEVTGVEPDPKAVEVARKVLDIEVCQGTLEDTEFTQDSFDALTMSHVIEHVADPLVLLKECKRVLKPGGRLVLVTPNVESLGAWAFNQAWLHWDPPRHLFLFSPRTLTRCVESAGLRILTLRTSALEAPSMWTQSRHLRRDGLIPGGRPIEPGLAMRLVALAFGGLEHLAGVFRPLGEEVMIIASKEIAG